MCNSQFNCLFHKVNVSFVLMVIVAATEPGKIMRVSSILLNEREG